MKLILNPSSESNPYFHITFVYRFNTVYMLLVLVNIHININLCSNSRTIKEKLGNSSLRNNKQNYLAIYILTYKIFLFIMLILQIILTIVNKNQQ